MLQKHYRLCQPGYLHASAFARGLFASQVILKHVTRAPTLPRASTFRPGAPLAIAAAFAS
jgi:hypothetical protein